MNVDRQYIPKYHQKNVRALVISDLTGIMDVMLNRASSLRYLNATIVRITDFSILRIIDIFPFDLQIFQITNDSRFEIITAIGTIVNQFFVED